MNTSFQFNQYLLRRQVFALTGKFRIFNPTGEMVMFSEQKMFRLKEDIRVYSDESKSQEMLYIQARQILDFSAAYDVIDSQAQQRVGTLRRRGLRSTVRDEWQIFNAQEQMVGVLQEDNLTMALVRRFIAGNWIPQNYDIIIGGAQVADIKQRFNLLRYELDMDFTMDTAHLLDHRLGLAAGILLAAIEKRQD